MLCQKCGQREAKVHVTKTINGQTSELYLCEYCAKGTGEINFVFAPGIMPDFLQALFGFSPGAVERPMETTCPQCGITFSQITQAGKLGCSHCYETFEPQLGPLLRRVHGSGQHVGKVPARRGVAIKSRLELKRLKEELQRLIQLEEFEKAAVVRDQIRQLEQSMGG